MRKYSNIAKGTIDPNNKWFDLINYFYIIINFNIKIRINTININTSRQGHSSETEVKISKNTFEGLTNRWVYLVQWRSKYTNTKRNTTEERMALSNRMNFWENSKRPSAPPPPLIFGKLCCKLFYNGLGRIYANRYDGQIVWNACTWFPEIGTILRGGGGGQLPFGTFPIIHPIW